MTFDVEFVENKKRIDANFGNVAALRSSVDENYIFGTGEPEHDEM